MKDILEKMSEHLENAKIELYRAIDRYNTDILRQMETDENYDGEKDFIIPPSERWDIKIENGYIRISIPDFLFRTNKIKREIYHRWAKNVRDALWSLDKCSTYEKIFVYVKYFYPGKNWDIDNKAIKPIIDGIVRAGVVEDDTYNRVAYGIEGGIKENPLTIIYIFDYNDIGKLLPVICNNDD